jgi:hypothetical protein
MSYVQHVQKEEGRSRQALLPGVPAPDFTLHRTPNQVVSLK